MHAPPGGLPSSQEEALFQIVALPYEALQDLPPLEFKVMTAALRYVNRAGECWPTLRQLAADVRKSEATICRVMQRLAEQYSAFAERTRAGNGRYRYKIAARFLPRWPGKRQPPDPSCTTMQDGLAQAARHKAEPVKQAREGRFAKSGIGQDGLPRPVDWAPRLRSWAKSRFWLPNWGPTPTEPGCWVPRELLPARS